MAETILLVEDDQDTARSLTKALESSGYRVTAVDTGTEARSIIDARCMEGVELGSFNNSVFGACGGDVRTICGGVAPGGGDVQRGAVGVDGGHAAMAPGEILLDGCAGGLT